MAMAASAPTTNVGTGIYTPATGIYTPGSIWAKALEQKAAAKPGRADSHMYFVGPSGSGKSTLLNRFLYPNKTEPAKLSAGLEYTFARKAAALDVNRKDLAHIWELSGGDALTAQLTQGSHVFLTHRQVATAVVVIVLDLSDPCSIMTNAVQWISLTRRKLAATYSMFERRGLQQLPRQLKARQLSKVLGQQHPDAQLVDCPGVSLVLACTKWDLLKDKTDPQALRVLAQGLRWLAHSNAAHLIYMGGLQPGATGSEGGKLLDSFTRLLNHLTFVGMDRRIPLKQPPSFDHLGPLLIPAGADSFSSIGTATMQPQPQQSGSAAGLPPATQTGWSVADIAAGQQEWHQAVSKVFPSKQGMQKQVDSQQQQQQQQEDGGSQSRSTAFTAAYKEDEVDRAYSQRESALEAYRQEVETQQQEQRRSRRKAAAVST